MSVHTACYEFTGGVDPVNPSYVSSSVIESCSQNGGGAKNGGAKKKKVSKTRRKKPLRRPLSKKAKRMTKMRRKNQTKLDIRDRKLSKRLKQRKARNSVIESLTSKEPLTDKQLSQLSPSMKKFVSKIPSSSALTSWPSLPTDEPQVHPGERTLNSARMKLAEILKKKPIYDQRPTNKAKGSLKYGDYIDFTKLKKEITKSDSINRSKNKKKGDTR